MRGGLSKWRLAIKYRGLYLIFLPVLVYFVIFSYVPMYGLQLAFKNYQYKLGIFASPWIGFENFEKLFAGGEFMNVLRNTVLISFARMIIGFPMPVIFALMLNELKNARFKKFVQSVSYLPYFISWVVLGGLFKEIFSPSRGVVNYVITLFGGQPFYFLVNDAGFIAVMLITGVWQSFGWGSIIYIAAISGIDQEMYEAAIVDGANRLQRAMRITLPSLKPVISIMLILGMGGILNAGFDQILNMYNETVLGVADIIDTYVYRIGILEGKFALSTAVGLFKNAVGLLMVLVTNLIVRRLTGEGIF